MNTKEEIINFLYNNIEETSILKITISNQIQKILNKASKIIIQKVIIKNNECFQISRFIENKVFHENINCDNIITIFLDIMEQNYKQCNIIANKNITILMNNKKQFKVTGIKNHNFKTKNIYHNKEKNYILKDGVFVDWLYKLDIMSKDGLVLQKKQKKFRQINKFLEMIDGIESYLPKNAIIVDMGCGKSYLTFAMYYYFNYIKNKNVIIKGFDLKKDVIDYCNSLAKQFNFINLQFFNEDIGNIDILKNKVNMIISLHACDTATDIAIYHGIKWNCDIILSVPCCQNEIYKQIKNSDLNIVLKHGILKERFSSILTDSIRAEVLSICNYKTSIIEFIDMEHTPKNIMIKAVKQNKNSENLEKINELKNLLKSYGVNQFLFEKLFK